MNSSEQLVKLDKLVKTLRREVSANPMKAGVLGVLLLGGMYFWVPLFLKWMGKTGTTAAPGAMVVPAVASEPPGGLVSGGQTGNSTAVIKETAITWREMRDRREADPLARSADYRPEWNQVFQVSAAAPTPVVRAETELRQPVELDPADLGMVLQGVVIGSKVKKAIINGKIYCEHDRVSVHQNAGKESNKDDEQPNVEFRLVRIFRRMVELERGGKSWQLQLTSVEPARTNSEANKQKTQDPLELNLEKGSSPIQTQAVTSKVEE